MLRVPYSERPLGITQGSRYAAAFATGRHLKLSLRCAILTHQICLAAKLGLKGSNTFDQGSIQDGATAWAAHQAKLLEGRQEALVDGKPAVTLDSLPVPVDVFASLKALITVGEAIESVQAEDEEDLLRAAEHWRSTCLKPLAFLAHACSASLDSLKRSQAECMKEAKAAERKAEARAKAVAKAAARAKPTAVSENQGIFDLDLMAFSSVAEAVGSGVSELAAKPCPYVVRPCPEVTVLAGAAPCRLNLLVFKAGFMKSTHEHQFMSLAGSEKVRSDLLQALSNRNPSCASLAGWCLNGLLGRV